MGRGLLYIFILLFAQTSLLANDEIEYSMVDSKIQMRAILRMDSALYPEPWADDSMLGLGSIVQAKRKGRVLGFMSFMVIDGDIEINRLLIREEARSEGIAEAFLEELSYHRQEHEGAYYNFKPTDSIKAILAQDGIHDVATFRTERTRAMLHPKTLYESLGILPSQTNIDFDAAFRSRMEQTNEYERLGIDFHSPDSKSDKGSNDYQKRLDDMFADIGLTRRDQYGTPIRHSHATLDLSIEILRDEIWRALNVLSNSEAKHAYDSSFFDGNPGDAKEEKCMAEYRRLSTLPRR